MDVRWAPWPKVHRPELLFFLHVQGTEEKIGQKWAGERQTRPRRESHVP